MRKRLYHSVEDSRKGLHSLPVLQIGYCCYIQNHAGNYQKRWYCSGKIVEDHGYHSCTAKVDESGRLTRQNHKHLRQFTSLLHHVAESTTNKNVLWTAYTTRIYDIYASARLLTQPNILNLLPASLDVNITASVPPTTADFNKSPISSCASQPQASHTTMESSDKSFHFTR